MPILEVKALSYSIDKHEILSPLSFCLEGGTITLLCGKNGSGKSMLLKCLKGLIKQSSGRIILNGKALKQKERMRALALVFQDADIATVGQTVEKDIAFGLENLGKEKKEIDSTVDKLIREFKLEKIRKNHPYTLSGGEKRKLTIAGVIAMEPEVILLDEPFANLDYPSTLLVLETIKELKENGHTLLIISHEVEKMIALSDHLLILKDGKIEYDGKPECGLSALKENDIYVPPIPFSEMTWL